MGSLNSPQLIEYVAKQIENTSVFNYPYEHLAIGKFFPSDVYQQLIENLPEVGFYKPMYHPDALRADQTSTRSVFELNSKNIQQLSIEKSKFWQELVGILSDDRVKCAFFNQYKSTLFKNFIAKVIVLKKYQPFPFLRS